jgi:hypothetical protein
MPTDESKQAYWRSGPALVIDPYRLTETWWGEPLDEKLAERMASAPRKQLSTFLDFALQEVMLPLPDLPAGETRPLLARYNSDTWRGLPSLAYVDSALSLLLYSHQVVLEDVLLPNLMAQRKDLRHALSKLLLLQPFAKAGLVHFFSFDRKLRHPATTMHLTPLQEGNVPQDLAGLVEELTRLSKLSRGYNFTQFMFSLRIDLGALLRYTQETPGKWHLVARSEDEALLLPIGLRTAALTTTDLRHLQLAKLCALDLPKLNVQSMWSVRRSSAEFAEWRASLGEALRQIEDFSSQKENWQQEARAILHAELAPVREKVATTARKSPALSTATSGLTTLSYSGIGALAGYALGGDPTASLAGAAAAKSAETIVSYLRALRERHHAKAVLDLTMSFISQEEP